MCIIQLTLVLHYRVVEHVEDRRSQPAGEEQQPLSDSSSEEEQRLVDAITAPGGVRAAPGREQLDQFIKKLVLILDAILFCLCVCLPIYLSVSVFV